ncbi:unnamed protein product [Closterium sp. NIES-65]|nr:unnamed protein product [Closterium sp. NIES-65]
MESATGSGRAGDMREVYEAWIREGGGDDETSDGRSGWQECSRRARHWGWRAVFRFRVVIEEEVRGVLADMAWPLRRPQAIRRVLQLGNLVVEELERLAETGDALSAGTRYFAREALHHLHTRTCVLDMKRFLRLPPHTLEDEIARGALIVAKLRYRDLDTDAVLNRLVDTAAVLRTRIASSPLVSRYGGPSTPRGAVAALQLLNGLLFGPPGIAAQPRPPHQHLQPQQQQQQRQPPHQQLLLPQQLQQQDQQQQQQEEPVQRQAGEVQALAQAEEAAAGEEENGTGEEEEGEEEDEEEEEEEGAEEEEEQEEGAAGQVREQEDPECLHLDGNRDDYYNPRNSYINDVLDSRRGIPISLAVLHAAIGRACGIPVRMVGIPLHFLTKVGEDGQMEERFMDCFNRRLLHREECVQLIRCALPRHLPLRFFLNLSPHLSPDPASCPNPPSAFPHSDPPLRFPSWPSFCSVLLLPTPGCVLPGCVACRSMGLEYNPRLLAPVGAQAVLVRMCNNLLAIYAQREADGDGRTQPSRDAQRRLLPLLDLLLAVNPSDVGERFHKAKLLLTVPDFDAVTAELHVLLQASGQQGGVPGAVPRALLQQFMDNAQQMRRQHELWCNERFTPRPADLAFRVGTIVRHRRFGYRGIVFGWDPRCTADETWIAQMQVDKLRLGRVQPFYRLLVDVRDHPHHTTYVPQENLVPSPEVGPVHNEELGAYFLGLRAGRYVPNAYLRYRYPDDFSDAAGR